MIYMSKKVFINANLWDGYADSVFKKCAVFVDGDKIAKISYDEKPDVSGYEVIDLNGKYVTPGLVNPHVHLFGRRRTKTRDENRENETRRQNP